MLRAKIREDFLTAYKAKLTTQADALRSIESVLKQVEIDTRKELSDEDVVKILRTELKKREEAIGFYIKGNRKDLADKETFEKELIKTYLPTQMSVEEIAKLVDRAKSELGDKANFGQLMQKTMVLAAGQADGKIVSEVVKTKLQ